MDVKEYKVKIDFDTKRVVDTLDIMQLVGRELETQLELDVFSSSHFYHFFPSAELSMSRNKLRELFIAKILRIFDAACIKHCFN